DQESRFTRDLMPGSSFTPDSKALVVSYGGKIWRVEVPSGQATPIPFTVKVHQDLGPLVRFDTRVDTGDVLVKQIRDASPSPDGRRLAFSALDKLYVMDLPGGTPRRLTTDSVHEQVPAWSPDGQWIAYVTWTDQGGHVEKIRADGRAKAQRLTPEPAFYDHPVWSRRRAITCTWSRCPWWVPRRRRSTWRTPRRPRFPCTGSPVSAATSSGGRRTRTPCIGRWGAASSATTRPWVIRSPRPRPAP